MGFFNTIGLLALIGIPVIIVLHMLKRKQKRLIKGIIKMLFS